MRYLDDRKSVEVKAVFPAVSHGRELSRTPRAKSTTYAPGLSLFLGYGLNEDSRIDRVDLHPPA